MSYLKGIKRSKVEISGSSGEVRIPSREKFFFKFLIELEKKEYQNHHVKGIKSVLIIEIERLKKKTKKAKKDIEIVENTKILEDIVKKNLENDNLEVGINDCWGIIKVVYNISDSDLVKIKETFME